MSHTADLTCLYKDYTIKGPIGTIVKIGFDEHEGHVEVEFKHNDSGKWEVYSYSQVDTDYDWVENIEIYCSGDKIPEICEQCRRAVVRFRAYDTETGKKTCVYHDFVLEGEAGTVVKTRFEDGEGAVEAEFERNITSGEWEEINFSQVDTYYDWDDFHIYCDGEPIPDVIC